MEQQINESLIITNLERDIEKFKRIIERNNSNIKTLEHLKNTYFEKCNKYLVRIGELEEEVKSLNRQIKCGCGNDEYLDKLS